MADTKISGLASKATPTGSDLAVVVDVADTSMGPSGSNKKVTLASLPVPTLAAPLASPALTGTPTAPTAAPGTNTTQVATTAFVLANAGAGGSGTVTSVSVVTANGVSGSVANATTTPGITLALGAITPTSVVASGAVSGSNLSGTNTGDQTITLTGNVTGSGSGSFATTIGAGVVTNSMLAGSIAAAKLVGSDITLAESQVTGLVSDLAGKAMALSRTPVKASAYTAASGELVPVDTTSGPVTITLPAAPANHSRLAVKHVVQAGSNVVTVTCGGSDTFNRAGGSASTTLALLAQGVDLIYDSGSATWTVLSDDLPLSQLDLRYSPLAGSTSIVTLGPVTTGTWNATPIGVGKGGTGLTTVASGKLLYASALDTLAPLTLGTNLSITGGTLNAAGGSGLTVGNAVSGGSASRLLYEDASQNLAASANLGFDGSNLVYLCGAAAGNPLVVRQTGGTAGTNELQISHDGNAAFYTNGVAMTGFARAGRHVFSGPILVPQNATDDPGHPVLAADFNNRGTGMYFRGDAIGFSGNTACTASLVAAGFLMPVANQFGWSNSSTPLVSQTFDTSLARAAAGVVKLTNGSTGSGGLASVGNTPTTLASSTNNYSPGVGLWQRWSASTPVSVTGMAAGQAGEIRYVVNAGSSTITLTNQDASSTAANQWLTTTGASLALAANRMALAIYDATTAAWRATLLP